jgi:hypothetical protein
MRLEYDAADLLATEEIEEPLVAAGVRCHGGFAHDGRYVSPRTLHRLPAIASWQDNHRRHFGTDILSVPLDTWPEQYPNVRQMRFLLDKGIRGPLAATLTRIGTVEGFGSMIRYTAVTDIQRYFVEDVAGTATAHLDRGLLEAHARDEAGYGAEGGHTAMWFAARDIALDRPVSEDETMRMLERMGLTRPPQRVDPTVVRDHAAAARHLADIPAAMQFLVATMVRILLIEIQAFHTFAWAEELLADTNLVGGDGEGARLVSYIRQDEFPHVEYLRTALTEMRDRTFVGESGEHHPGSAVVGFIWEAAMAESLGPRRKDMIRIVAAEAERGIEAEGGDADLIEEFHSLGSVRPPA